MNENETVDITKPIDPSVTMEQVVEGLKVCVDTVCKTFKITKYPNIAFKVEGHCDPQIDAIFGPHVKLIVSVAVGEQQLNTAGHLTVMSFNGMLFKDIGPFIDAFVNNLCLKLLHEKVKQEQLNSLYPPDWSQTTLSFEMLKNSMELYDNYNSPPSNVKYYQPLPQSAVEGGMVPEDASMGAWSLSKEASMLKKPFPTYKRERQKLESIEDLYK